MNTAMNTAQLREFQRVMRSSDRPLDATDSYYVPSLHGTDAEDQVVRLFQAIQDTQGSGLYYFTGQRGTGKSTELRRLKTLLDGDGYRCVLFDSFRYLNETQPVDAEMIMLMVAAGLADWMIAEYKTDLLAESPPARFWQWLKSDVELQEISIPKTGLTFDIKTQQDSIAKRIRALSSRQRFHQELVAHIAAMGQWVRNRENRQLVLIVDSLENLRGNPLAGDEGAMFASVARVFSNHLEMLRVLDVQIVYSVPPYLGLLENVQAHVPWYALASVRVCGDPRKTRRQARPEGLQLMRRLMDKRWPEWRNVLQEAALDRLSLLSGGDLRQFILRIMVDVLFKAQFALDRLPLGADDAILEDVALACSTEMLQLTVRDEWPLLKQVTMDNKIVANRHDQLKELAHLLDTKVILNYRNGHDWYDIHPSLWAELDAFSIDPV